MFSGGSNFGEIDYHLVYKLHEKLKKSSTVLLKARNIKSKFPWRSHFYYY